MRRKSVYSLMLGLVLVLSLQGVLAAAQESHPIPLMLLTLRNLYAYSEDTRQLQPMLNHPGVRASVSGFSPDGKYLAYEATLIDADPDFVHFIPNDVWLLNLQSGQTTPLTPPQQLSSFDVGIERKQIVWSPDATRLAWVQRTRRQPDDQHDLSELVVYDLQRQTQTIIDSNENGQAFSLWNVNDWSSFGISLIAGVDGYAHIRVYDAEQGKFIFDIISDNSLLAGQHVILKGREYLYVTTWLWKDTGWKYLIIDPLTNEYVDLYYPDAMIEGWNNTLFTNPIFANFNPLAPPDSISRQGYHIVRPQNQHENLEPLYIDPAKVRVAPDGESYASMMQSGWEVYVRRDGETTTIKAPNKERVMDLLWGPERWRIVGETCGGKLVSRLSVSQEVQLIADTYPAEFREQPDESSPVVDQLLPGKAFSIIGGPQCAYSAVWWQVNYEGETGWVVEGIEDIYFIEPVQPSNP